jgi:peroxiredoxin
MLKSRFTWVLLFLGVLLLGSAWILESREADDSLAEAAGVAEAPAVGYRAPDFTLTTLSGESYTLSEQQGRPVVLNFWATWCPPCRAEIPHFQEASIKYNGQVDIIGIDDGETVAKVAPFAQEMGITYPLPVDEKSLVSRRYRVNSLPTTYFIDAEGVIQHVHIGLINRAVLESQIEQLIRS